MLKLSFSKLKSNYTTDPTNIHTCSMHFPNTCAIRMSEAIVKTESRYLDAFKNSTKNKCPHSYIRGAQDLAAILAQPNQLGSRTYGWSGNPLATVPGAAKGKQGIVCFMNIPGFSGQGHIDLWDKNFAVGSDYWDAKTIWFWELSS
jgi:hypothetical protein